MAECAVCRRKFKSNAGLLDHVKSTKHSQDASQHVGEARPASADGEAGNSNFVSLELEATPPHREEQPAEHAAEGLEEAAKADAEQKAGEGKRREEEAKQETEKAEKEKEKEKQDAERKANEEAEKAKEAERAKEAEKAKAKAEADQRAREAAAADTNPFGSRPVSPAATAAAPSGGGKGKEEEAAEERNPFAGRRGPDDRPSETQAKCSVCGALVEFAALEAHLCPLAVQLLDDAAAAAAPEATAVAAAAGRTPAALHFLVGEAGGAARELAGLGRVAVLVLGGRVGPGAAALAKLGPPGGLARPAGRTALYSGGVREDRREKTEEKRREERSDNHTQTFG